MTVLASRAPRRRCAGALSRDRRCGERRRGQSLRARPGRRVGRLHRAQRAAAFRLRGVAPDGVRALRRQRLGQRGLAAPPHRPADAHRHQHRRHRRLAAADSGFGDDHARRLAWGHAGRACSSPMAARWIVASGWCAERRRAWSSRIYQVWTMPASDSQYAVTIDSSTLMPLRDGARLETYIVRPVGPGPFGVVMQRSPYRATNPAAGTVVGVARLHLHRAAGAGPRQVERRRGRLRRLHHRRPGRLRRRRVGGQAPRRQRQGRVDRPLRRGAARLVRRRQHPAAPRGAFAHRRRRPIRGGSSPTPRWRSDRSTWTGPA